MTWPHDKPMPDAPQFWPRDEPIPEYCIKQKIPCPKCRRVYMDDESRAVVKTQSGKGDGTSAYFRCRNCENAWALPVKEIPE